MTQLFFQKKVRWISGFLFFLIVFTSCSEHEKESTITGTTMGTTYSVKIRFDESPTISATSIKNKIDSTLMILNQQVSTYIPSSEISRFNALSAGEWFEISHHFQAIVEQALDVFTISGGAFDITVHPLVRLWGFGIDGGIWEPPSESDIRHAMNTIGSKYLTLSGNQIKKDIPGLELDLSAIAKGYGVDLISQLLLDLKFNDYMVEIGGEVRCQNGNANNSWRIGIEIPADQQQTSEGFAGVIHLDDLAMATSGNYRNYFIHEGHRYSHTINPKTGKPVDHTLASATIITSTCMNADALATAVMVLGAIDGLELIESLDGVECFLIEENIDGSTITHSSDGFGKFIE